MQLFGLMGFSEYSCDPFVPYVFGATIADGKVAANSDDITNADDPDFGPRIRVHWTWRVLAVLDMPFSIALDTVTLPLTVPLQISDAVRCP